MRTGILVVLLGFTSLLAGAYNVDNPSPKPLGLRYSLAGKTTTAQDHMISLTCIGFGLLAIPSGALISFCSWKEIKRNQKK